MSCLVIGLVTAIYSGYYGFFKESGAHKSLHAQLCHTLMVQEFKQLIADPTFLALRLTRVASFHKQLTQPTWSNQNVSSREKVSS